MPFFRPRRRASSWPLRYRGYVYDPETGLYYLQSRYYDPELGRFFNADAFVSTGQGQLGNNMFAYCGNNPVNLIDPLGYWHWPTWDEVEEWLKEAVDVPVQVALGIIGGVCGLWGIGRAVSAIWEEMYD